MCTKRLSKHCLKPQTSCNCQNFTSYRKSDAGSSNLALNFQLKVDMWYQRILIHKFNTFFTAKIRIYSVTFAKISARIFVYFSKKCKRKRTSVFILLKHPVYRLRSDQRSQVCHITLGQKVIRFRLSVSFSHGQLNNRMSLKQNSVVQKKPKSDRKRKSLKTVKGKRGRFYNRFRHSE